ncbi:RNA polymerase sigma factor [Flavobacterium sp. ASW18X]|uniref:RNA polymerase sigma factor n=1 Tax=Flavobacterium sp. ASW18X TaxID=2572595 RepID=UPI0010AE1AEF|nr:sigma-70 family RNA polymerase sigma factor [Flavobacterium sp. ASW18X]TKD62600.1 sigma-70 family RNA polymerase sigma factor [Flavobacterium sp. ASW18X]
MDLDNLILKFKQQDATAFETLHQMYAENICGVINTIVRNPERAQELCQDVFIKIWHNADSYDKSKGRFFTWILNIARNTAIDEVRSKSHKNDKKNLQLDYFVGIVEGAEDMDERTNTIGLKKLVKDLKEKCLQVIELLYFKGYTQKEVAEELNIPVGTVKTRNRSCISKLRENLNL